MKKRPLDGKIRPRHERERYKLAKDTQQKCKTERKQLNEEQFLRESVLGVNFYKFCNSMEGHIKLEQRELKFCVAF